MRILAIDGGLTKANPAGLVVLDLDPLGLRYGAALAYGDKLEWFERIWRLSKEIESEAQTWRVDAVAWEMPPLMRSNAQTAIKLSHIGGAALAVASRLCIPAQPVQPAEAKKALAGRGNADKAQMMLAAMERLNVDVVKDIADAIGVALAAAELIARRQRMMEAVG